MDTSKESDQVARLLIENGADVNATFISDKFTPLHIAYLTGRRNNVNLLINNGADQEALDSNGMKPKNYESSRVRQQMIDGMQRFKTGKKHRYKEQYHNAIKVASVRELMTEMGFDGDNLPVIRGSALSALEGKTPEIGSEAINKLLNEIDNYIPTPERDLDKPFSMPVEHVFSIPNRGTVVSGLLEQGVIKKGNECEILGYNKTVKSTVTGVEMFHQLLDQAQAGDQLGVLIRGVKRDEIRRGMILAKPGTHKMNDHVDAQVYVLKKEEGGRAKPFASFATLNIFSKTWDCTAQVLVPEDSIVMPGTHAKLSLKLIKPMVFSKGQRFTIRDGKVTVGTGVVTDIQKPLSENERIEILGGKKAREKRVRQEADKAAKAAAKKGK